MNFLLQSKSISIFGLSIHLYGVFIALGILAGMGLAYWSFKKRGLETKHIVNIVLVAIPSAILGARIYYCAFIGKNYSFASFFDIASGGLAVYGGIIGAAIAIIIYCAIVKINFLSVADSAVPSLAVGQCLGRIGCYFGGCCYGEETTLQLFPLSVEINGVWHLATFFYESFATLLICVVLVCLLRKIKLKGYVFASYFALYGIARFIIEGFRGDSLYIFNTIRVSQLLSAILVVLAIGFIVYLTISYKKKGLLSKIFVGEETTKDNNEEISKGESNQIVKEENKSNNVENSTQIELNNDDKTEKLE